MDVDDLIERAGGPDKLADRLGVARTTIYDWRRLGFVPGNRLPDISRELGLSPDLLIQLVKPPSPRSKSEAA